jgi:hypothetical protein
MELNAVGFRSPWAFLWYFLFFVAPLVYIYIALMLLRDLCESFPEMIQQPLQHYVPYLAKLVTLMKSYYGFRLVDVWCVIEALFYISCKLKIAYLQGKDPLEASLSAAPMLDSDERKMLWDHMMEVDKDPSWISEWFLDRPPMESISRYDIFDFICWAMFDGRNQEHLTSQELQDLEALVEDLEYRVGLHLYGEEMVVSSSNLSSLQRLPLVEDETEGETDDQNNDDAGNVDIESVAETRDRINSDMATTNLSDPNLIPFDEEESQDLFHSPKRTSRQGLYDENSSLGSGSGCDWTSMSSRRPRPRKRK